MAELYRLPRLQPWGWRSQGAPLPAFRRALGADLDQGLVYLLGAQHEVLALDLQTARVRPPVATGVREAAIGPDGTLFTVSDSLAVVALVRRNPVRLQGRLPGPPRDLFGTKESDALAITAGRSNQFYALHADAPAARMELPPGDAAATFWGDLVAIAADTAVILVDPSDPGGPMAMPVTGHARAVLFSPSGHRLYVARREGPILVFNRYSGEQIGDIELPRPASALRADPWGRWLLVHPGGADSVWLVDGARGRLVAGFATAWASDVPTVTNQGILLVKQRADLVAYDLNDPAMPETGRVPGGAADLWLPLAWTPETGTASTSLEPEAPAIPADQAEATLARVFLQVSSSQNRAWSGELARQLAEAGLPAQVLDPRPGEEGFRVVLGPYPSREAAESVGRKLGRPFFIYQPDR
ncbi:MAG TPA: SPOR domain-containing protein [Gemmatimonadales bacterium]|nr:SPOR domain-containing protein [Gemmatimonadales bacterium]